MAMLLCRVHIVIVSSVIKSYKGCELLLSDLRLIFHQGQLFRTMPGSDLPLGVGVAFIPGLDREKVEKERKEMWRKIFEKYEDLEQRNQLTDEVSLEDIDNPETVNGIIKESSKFDFIKSNTTLKQFLVEYADEIDEIATIAGPPASDEEVLSDESEDESLCDVDPVDSTITPPSSVSSEEINDGDLDLIDIEDNDDTLIGYEEEVDNLLCNHTPLIKSDNVLIPQDLETQPSTTLAEQDISDTGQGEASIAGDETEESDCLKCSTCHLVTFYEALSASSGFQCDECLAGDHLDCEVEECRQCKQVGEIISLRRKAEVLGRIEKMTGRKFNHL